MNRINSKAAVLSVAAVMGFTAFASADTVDMNFTGTAKGSNVKVTLTSNTFNVFAGQLKHTMQNGTGTGANLSGNYITFCSDLYETVTSSYKTYTLTDLNNLPDSSPMGHARAGAICKRVRPAPRKRAHHAAECYFADAIAVNIRDVQVVSQVKSHVLGVVK